MPDNERVIYSINVEDLQTVTQEELGRELSPDEVLIIEQRVGDFIDWYGAIVNALGLLSRQPA